MKKFFSKEKWKYLLYTMSHPMDGFYWIRHRDYGSLPIAVLLVIVFSVCFSINRIFANFVVNDVDPVSVNTLGELGGILLLYLLICVSNWSVTCLMSGEGRLKDIAIVVGYACLPPFVITIKCKSFNILNFSLFILHSATQVAIIIHTNFNI